jgi:hypothetical protein
MTDQSTLNEQTDQAQQDSQGITDTEASQTKYRRRSFSDRLLEADLLVAGITNHIDTLTAKGMRQDYLTGLQTILQETRSINEEQEKFKAEQKECTSRLQVKATELNRAVREGQQMVKLHIPQTLWLEFGMKQKR